jgi:NodT family efflux transporter outer membrane factor (OMF) lipoprotein
LTLFPASWREAKTSPVEKSAIRPDWWKNFKTKELDDMMARALANNTSLKASEAQILQARALLQVARGPLFPQLDATGNVSDSKTNPRPWLDKSSGGLSVSYQLDLFGGNRASAAAAEANLKGSIFAYDALALLTMSETAQGYFTLVNLRERVRIAEKNLGDQRETLKIVQKLFDDGSATAITLATQKALVATTEATVSTLKNQAVSAEDALSVLLGETPQDFRLKTRVLRQVHVPEVPVSQPARVAEQRPDIRQAEQSLIAANANIGVARAALFPNITLGGTAGAAAASAAILPLNPATGAFSLAASLVAPIFHGGALRGAVRQATAVEMQLAQNYRTTVLTALQQVEDALSSVKTSKVGEKALATAMTESRKAYSLSLTQYQQGSISYQTLLTSEVALLNAEDAHATAELNMLNAAVGLYQALGGGWKDRTAASNPPKKT